MISKVIAEELIHKLKREIENAENIVLVTHVGPDGDALGSALGMWHFLMTIDKTPTVIVPSPPPNFLMWMPGADRMIIYSEKKEEADKAIDEAELILAVDFNTPNRLALMAEKVVNAKAHKILIDHHLNPSPDFANVVISYPQISSTSELIFRAICRMGHFSDINLGCAECIYVGMMTDTGGFTYNSNHEEIYSIIYELIKLGVDKDDIYRKVYNTFSADRMRLMGYCLYKKMKIYPEYQAALITLTQKELHEFNYDNGDAEGFVNIPLSIEGINFTVFMREDPDKIKVSLRSQGTFPTNKFASEVFGGGGHLNASGGESFTTLQAAVRKFEEALPLYREFLDTPNP
ncbi:MAG: bifunctional oligoribonuclease/PAP phosphatase NrnA [Paludibacteraceae bacterium]|nr:bifunctional oligoribonuclease/PAP phosphatase NrnA [Bacteroidia bacterium]HRG02713.1 bifunctional oligoribonuclease/PAP phosphatase NrnA [Paludibacteraceae bacterium]